MQNSPLRLIHYFVTKVAVEATSPQEKHGPGTFEAKVETTSMNKEAAKWAVTLRVNFVRSPEQDALPPPYTGSIEMIGLFEVDKDYPEAKTKALVHANGAAVLFGAVRELFAAITSKGPHRVPPLPLVMFIDEVRECPSASLEPQTERRGKVSRNRVARNAPTTSDKETRSNP